MIFFILLPATTGASELRHDFRHLHLITEFSYGGASVSMQKKNDFYLDKFAIPAGMFDSRYHWCHFFSPEIGLIIRKNIVSIVYQHYYGSMRGPAFTTPENKTVRLNLYTLNGSILPAPFQLSITGTIGDGISAGRGDMAISYKQSSILLPPVDMYAYGGGGSLFGDVCHVFRGNLLRK
ncbi:MAG: hypothetical protein JW863_04170 [Chitinispirillaceae bacterium]|nr:hypothetical protein [Chitinispirillaceae bacterium]